MLTFADILTAQLDAEFARRGAPLCIIETGTIRGDSVDYENGDGWSTLAIARWVKDNGGRFYSIDLDTSHAARVLQAHRLSAAVSLIQEHSITGLTQLAQDGVRADVILLDSENDAQLALHEFLIAREMMRGPAVLLVDDVEPESTEIVKAHAVMAWLTEHGIGYELLRRESETYSTGVLLAAIP